MQVVLCERGYATKIRFVKNDVRAREAHNLKLAKAHFPPSPPTRPLEPSRRTRCVLCKKPRKLRCILKP